MLFQFYIYFIFLFSWQKLTDSDACGCISVKSKSELYRYTAKYEKDFSNYPSFAGTISSETVRAWEKIYNKKTRRVFDASERMKNTPEDTLYMLAGYIYEAKMNKNDCDLHLEIGTEDPQVLRTVAEITKDNCKLQEQILQQLQAKGFVIGRQNATGIKCTLTGLGFYDGKHPYKKNKKYEHGSAWEIHPVIAIRLE